MADANDKNNAIELIFSVKGGGEISGESGSQIKKDIEHIAEQIKPEIIFSADISKAKEELEKLKKDCNITISVKTNNSGSKSGGGGSVTAQVSAYNELKQALTNYGRALKTQASQTNTSSKQYKEATALVEAYRQRYEDLLQTCSKDLTFDQLSDLASFKNQVENLANITSEAQQAAQRYKEYESAVKSLCQAKLKEINSTNSSTQAQAKARDEVERCKQVLASLSKDGFTPEEQEKIKQLGLQYVELQTQARNYQQIVADNKAAQQVAQTEAQYKTLQAALSELINRYSKWNSVSKDVATTTQKAINLLNQPLDNDPEKATAQVTAMKTQIKELSTEFSTGAREADTFYNKIRLALSSEIVNSIASAMRGVFLKVLKDVYNTVVDIDSAMTQLKIVTKETDAAMDNFGDKISSIAKSIGASISDLTESVTTFARLGFSLSESTEYATLIAQYAKVADTSVTEATSNMTAAIKAFNITENEFESALDKLIKIGNTQAVTSEELGEALNNAASALAANANSYEEALGMIAAANATVQDIDKASTALRTIAARISASTTELEELGETTDDVLATADLANVMAAYGVSITDANGELLSTYDILSQVADVWGTLKSTERAAIAEVMAGKLMPVCTEMCI